MRKGRKCTPRSLALPSWHLQQPGGNQQEQGHSAGWGEESPVVQEGLEAQGIYAPRGDK